MKSSRGGGGQPTKEEPDAGSKHDLGYELLRRFVRLVEDRLDATRLQLVNVYEDR